MRLWSLHPRYLDRQGLCNLWHEAIIARNALEEGETHQYWNHPQLKRFKGNERYRGDAIRFIHYYLSVVYQESLKRGYDFNEDAFALPVEDSERCQIPVPNGQLDFEYFHLAKKLEDRGSMEKVELLDHRDKRFLDIHPLFYMINGSKADFEKE